MGRPKIHYEKAPWIDRVSTDIESIEEQRWDGADVKKWDVLGRYQANRSSLEKIRFLTSSSMHSQRANIQLTIL